MKTLMMILLLTTCVISQTTGSNRRLINKLSDSIAVLQDIVAEHEVYIADDMRHKREYTEQKQSLAEQVTGMDKTQFYVIIGIMVNFMLSGGHVLTANPITRAIILSLAARIKREHGNGKPGGNG
jgi:hypothetical protein